MDRNASEWRLEEIEEWLTGDDYKAIKDIPICQHGGSDRLIWPFTKNVEYTIRSGYHNAKEEQIVSVSYPSFSYLINEKVWKRIWRINLPSKIQNFLWRVRSKDIPVGELLWKKGC